MKRLVLLLAVSALTFMPTAGFSSERDLTPTEETVLSDFDYDLDIEVCSENAEVAECYFAPVDSSSFNGLNRAAGLKEFALMTPIKMANLVYEVDWYQNNYRNTNKLTSNTAINHYTTPGGANLKISLS